MKRLVRTLFLAGVLMALLCVTAMAAEEEGIRAEKPEGTYPVTISAKEKDNLTVTVSNPKDGAQYLVLALSGDSTTPSASNIVYIDQNANGTFKVYPSKLANDTTYRVYVTSDKDDRYNNGLTEVASFQYYAPFTLGDVNEDKKINSSDALMALQAAVKKIQLTDTQISAADVTKDGKLNSSDALKILQYAVKKITSFD